MKARPTLTRAQRIGRLRERAGLQPKVLRYSFRLRTGNILRIPLPIAWRMGLAPGDVLQWSIAVGRAEVKILPKAEARPRGRC